MTPADVSGQWVAIASLVVALAVLVFGAIQFRVTARKDYVDELSKRVDQCEERHKDCEARHKDCERERERLTRLSMDLMTEHRERDGRDAAQGAGSPSGA